MAPRRTPKNNRIELETLQRKANSLETELRRRKESDLAAKRLAAIVESSDDAIIFKDLSGTIKSWNKGAERIFGYTADEAIGKPVTMLIPQDRLDEEPGILARIRRGERVDHFETIRQRKDGQLLNISLTVSPVKDDEGNIIGASKIARDITERKRNEQLIRQQASLFDQAYDAIFVWRWNGPITLWNRGAERLYGFPRDKAIGMVSHKMLNTQTQDGIARLLARLEQEGFWEGELLHTTSDGRKIAVESRMVLVRESGHGYVLEANRDITQRKYSEQKIAKSLEQEREANRVKDDFLAILSHELRTPLSPVLLIASDCATNPELSAEVRNHFRSILSNVETEVRLIDDLLDLTRINHGKLRMNLTGLDAHAILSQAIETVREQTESKSIHLTLNLKASHHRVSGDSVRLQQIFWNVLKNAAKFTPKDGTITVETASSHESNRFIVKVMDTGIGMMPEELERLFASFSQGDHIRHNPARYGGLGLGLAISKKLVEMHSGRIHANSEGRNKGSLFTIELPLSV